MPGHISDEMRALAIVGVCIVFGVLTLIAIVVALFKRLDDRWQAHEAALAGQLTSRTQNIDDTTLLLITAAAATVVGGRFRVRRIHRLLPMRTKRTPWSSQGRLILQGSHSISRKRGSR
ncbi:MAG: OadG family protein [Gemmatimonadales bacterium]|nr:OadG family protein [Gemmatimonadales bacterium]